MYYPKIDMSGNDIRTLRFSRIGCHTDTLILSDCKIERIKIGPKKANSLRYAPCWHAEVVDLSKNQITSMEEAMAVSPKVEVLNLSQNRITKASTTEELEVLNLSENELEAIGKNFLKKGNSLRLLDLSVNDIEKLPRCFKHGEKLEELDLSGNQLTRISCNFSKCSKLSKVNLRGNPMSEEYVNELRTKWKDIEFLF